MNVSCPTCGETGKLAKQLIGVRIKCKKCSTSFLVNPPGTPATVDHPEPAASGHLADGIAVSGLDDSAWSAAPAVAVAPPPVAVPAPVTDHDEAASSFSAAPIEPPAAALVAAATQYKLLTQKDKWFEGKFDLARLEEALNHYAHQGWVVRSMATPHVMGFSGGMKEEIVVLLER